MRNAGQSRVMGLLGVGFDSEDEQIRITQADNYQIIMGSGESHQALQKICRTVNERINQSGRVLSDYTPEEFMKLMREIC
ncbi:MAG: hypothetical protein JEZ10_06365 [Verrucomicrobia bacterium]|nr:hypothetical protein [Verrucomicrobiota bacterium]